MPLAVRRRQTPAACDPGQRLLGGVHNDAWFGSPKIKCPGRLSTLSISATAARHIGELLDDLEADDRVETPVADRQRQGVPEHGYDPT